MLKLQSSEVLGGGAEDHTIVVCIDETHMTRKKKDRGGFQGRTTSGHSTVIVGFYELDIAQEPRVGTGRVVLVEVPNKSRATLEALIRKHVKPGSIVWTDGFSSYKWLGAGSKRGEFSAISGYTWDWVNHASGEFVRGEGVTRVSTNGVEGLFGRVKRFMRASGATKTHDRMYAFYIAEFLWRERFLSQRYLGTPDWELPAVWLLADLLSFVYKRKYVADVGLSLMTASNAEELRGLRAECFPSVPVFPVRAPRLPSAPAPSSSRLVAPTRFESLVAHGSKRTIIDLESDSDIEVVQP